MSMIMYIQYEFVSKKEIKKIDLNSYKSLIKITSTKHKIEGVFERDYALQIEYNNILWFRFRKQYDGALTISTDLNGFKPVLMNGLDLIYDGAEYFINVPLKKNKDNILVLITFKEEISPGEKLLNELFNNIRPVRSTLIP